MPAENDREWNLQRLAAENGRWAEEELRLIEAIREHKRRLKELPTIIRKLRGEREHAMAEMKRTGREKDALEAEGFDCPYPCDGCEAVLGRGENCPSYVSAAEFRAFAVASRARALAANPNWIGIGEVPFYSASERAAFREWANDQADDYADHKLAVQPPVGW